MRKKYCFLFSLEANSKWFQYSNSARQWEIHLCYYPGFPSHFFQPHDSSDLNLNRLTGKAFPVQFIIVTKKDVCSPAFVVPWSPAALLILYIFKHRNISWKRILAHKLQHSYILYTSSVGPYEEASDGPLPLAELTNSHQILPLTHASPPYSPCTKSLNNSGYGKKASGLQILFLVLPTPKAREQKILTTWWI